MSTPQPVSCFSLAPLTVPYAEWKGKTQLFHNGQATDTYIEGCDLRAQYSSPDYILLATEYDCPFEEAVTITLLDPELKVQCSATVPETGLNPFPPSYWFESINWHDEHNFDLHIKDADFFFRYKIGKPLLPLKDFKLTKQRMAKQPA